MEEYVEIPSDSGITFNVQPKMKALEIGEKARDAILSGKFHQVLLHLVTQDIQSIVWIQEKVQIDFFLSCISLGSCQRA